MSILILLSKKQMSQKSKLMPAKLYIIISGILFASFLPIHTNIEAIANTYSNNKKSKLTANFESKQESINNIRAWFSNYDQIRRQAQMSAVERQSADQIMSKGLSIFMPGTDKAMAHNLLSELVRRYEIAAQQMASLPVLKPTEQLHRAYYQYFLDAKNLFTDYLKLQDDLLATDPNTGQPVASGLVQRKENLATLDQNNKMLDEKLRQEYSIQSYQYQPQARY